MGFVKHECTVNRMITYAIPEYTRIPLFALCLYLVAHTCFKHDFLLFQSLVTSTTQRRSFISNYRRKYSHTVKLTLICVFPWEWNPIPQRWSSLIFTQRSTLLGLLLNNKAFLVVPITIHFLTHLSFGLRLNSVSNIYFQPSRGIHHIPYFQNGTRQLVSHESDHKRKWKDHIHWRGNGTQRLQTAPHTRHSILETVDLSWGRRHAASREHSLQAQGQFGRDGRREQLVSLFPYNYYCKKVQRITVLCCTIKQSVEVAGQSRRSHQLQGLYGRRQPLVSIFPYKVKHIRCLRSTIPQFSKKFMSSQGAHTSYKKEVGTNFRFLGGVDHRWAYFHITASFKRFNVYVVCVPQFSDQLASMRSQGVGRKLDGVFLQSIEWVRLADEAANLSGEPANSGGDEKTVDNKGPGMNEAAELGGEKIGDNKVPGTSKP